MRTRDVILTTLLVGVAAVGTVELWRIDAERRAARALTDAAIARCHAAVARSCAALREATLAREDYENGGGDAGKDATAKRAILIDTVARCEAAWLDSKKAMDEVEAVAATR